MNYNKKAFELGSHRSIIREIFEYSRTRAAKIGSDKVFDFSLGNPSVPAPDEVNEAILSLVNEKAAVALHGYTSAPGGIEVRTKIAEKIKTSFGVDMTADLIYMTCGAAASLTSGLKAVLCEGEECIVFAPYFTEYKVFIENAGATVRPCRPCPKTLLPDLSEFESLINERTGAVIINSPNNPSGVVYTEATVNELCRILKAKSEELGRTIYVIADEPYRELVYEGTEVPYLMNYYDDTLVCYSYSKSLSLPGERIGYVAVCPKAKYATEVFLSICGAARSMGYVCAPSLFQEVISRCIDCKVNVEAYRKNRDLIYNALTDYGFDCIKPDGAFYLFVRSPEEDAYAFFERAKSKEILLVPCDDFGVKGFLRLAYCVDTAKIEASLPTFKALAEEYGLKKA